MEGRVQGRPGRGKLINFKYFFFSFLFANEGVNQEGEDKQEEHKHGLPPLSFEYSL
jgi:hypothetical protein